MRYLLVLSVLGALALGVGSVHAESQLRILSVGGTVSEIICALGACDSIVATDSSSVFPAQLKQRPQVGYSRSLSAEGLLAQRAELHLLSEEAGPPTTIDRLKSFQGQTRTIQNRPTLEGARARIEELGLLLGKQREAQSLITGIDAAIARLKAEKSRPVVPLRVLFVYARGQKLLMVAGRDTAADTMIALAGGLRVGGDFEGFKPLSPEGVAAARPDLILMGESGVASLGGEAAVWKLPGIMFTPAFQGRRLFVMDDLLLLGMGPRLGQAAWQLAEGFYPPSKPESELGQGSQK